MGAVVGTANGTGKGENLSLSGFFEGARGSLVMSRTVPPGRMVSAFLGYVWADGTGRGNDKGDGPSQDEIEHKNKSEQCPQCTHAYQGRGMKFATASICPPGRDRVSPS